MSKRHPTPESGGVQLSLIVTPMLDMSFQILSFFIMSYNPSALEAQVPSNLAPPETFASKSKDAKAQADEIPQSVDPSAFEDQLGETVTVKMTTAPAGTEGREIGWPGDVLMWRKSNPAPETIVDAKNHRLTKAENGGLYKTDLPAKLKAVFADAAKEKPIARIDADGEVKHEWIMQAYDIAKQAGFSDVRFVPPPNLRSAQKK